MARGENATARPNRVLNDKQAAQFLGVAVQTLRNWRGQRRGPDYIKLGRSVRYSEGDLSRFLESRKIKVSE